MIMWHIINDEKEWQIEVGPVTILKGSHSLWYKLARLIDDYFTNKDSDVKVYEDTQIIHKKDWECLFIPYDAHLQLDKISAKSPLKAIVEDVCNELSLSPVFHELQNIWEDLREEVELLHHKTKKYGINIKFGPLEIDQLKPFLSFHSSNKMMTPIEYKRLLLNLFVDKVIEKKRLIIIELPELFADAIEFGELVSLVNQYSNRGIHFLIITEGEFKGNYNYIHEVEIINEARIEKIKRKVLLEIPFFCEEELFNQAKRSLLEVVDNFRFTGRNLTITLDFDEQKSTIIFVLAHHLNVRLDLDTSGFSHNIIRFINSYS